MLAKPFACDTRQGLRERGCGIESSNDCRCLERFCVCEVNRLGCLAVDRESRVAGYICLALGFVPE